MQVSVMFRATPCAPVHGPHCQVTTLRLMGGLGSQLKELGQVRHRTSVLISPLAAGGPQVLGTTFLGLEFPRLTV